MKNVLFGGLLLSALGVAWADEGIGKTRYQVLSALEEIMTGLDLPWTCNNVPLMSGEKRVMCQPGEDATLVIELIGLARAPHTITVVTTTSTDPREVVLPASILLWTVKFFSDSDQGVSSWFNEALKNPGRKQTHHWQGLRFELSNNVNGLGLVLLSIKRPSPSSG